jgi:hypothetical protein
MQVGANRPLLQPRDLPVSELDIVRLLRLDQRLLSWSHMRLQHGLLLRLLQLLLFHLFFLNRPKAHLGETNSNEKEHSAVANSGKE